MEQIRIIDGIVPVLFSAPHNFRHYRKNLDNKTKMLEEGTAQMVEVICKETSCWGIYSQNDLDYDPNYDIEKFNQYKSEIREISNRIKLDFFVDVHGILDNDKYDFNILYKKGFPKSAQLALDIKRIIEKGLLSGSNIVINNFLYDYGESISDFVCSRLRVPAVQVEISKSIREDSALCEQFIKNIADSLVK